MTLNKKKGKRKQRQKKNSENLKITTVQSVVLQEDTSDVEMHLAHLLW